MAHGPWALRKLPEDSVAGAVLGGSWTSTSGNVDFLEGTRSIECAVFEIRIKDRSSTHLPAVSDLAETEAMIKNLLV